MASEHAAVVLAAGLSRRLGRPKQLLRRDGVSLLRHALDAVLATAPLRVVAVLPADMPALERELDGLPVERCVNAAPQTGIAGSLQRAAAALADHRGPTLIVGVDQIHLRRAHLDALLASGGEDDVASGYGAAFGLPVRVGAATLRRAAELSGDVGFRSLWSRSGASPRRVEAPELAFDLDTPDALATAIAAGWIDR